MRKRIKQATACAIGISVAAVGASFAQTALSRNPPLPVQTNADWMKGVTALVIAPDGTWGTATEAFISRALATAIANCKSKYRHDIGCGYQSVSIREGWSFAVRCGQENIVVAAKTLRAAEQAAIDAELNLRRDYKPDMSPCVRVVSVDPEGAIVAADTVRLLQFVMDRRR